MSSEFKVGDKVTCWDATSCYHLTKGKQYTITKYEPKNEESSFTWPAYAGVINDANEEVVYHARRFTNEQP